MENKYKKTLAKIAAIFSIIAVFSFGIVDKGYASVDPNINADDPKAELDNAAAQNSAEAIFKELEDGDEVKEIKDGAESSYHKEITPEDLNSTKSISGESSDIFKEQLQAYESQENAKNDDVAHNMRNAADNLNGSTKISQDKPSFVKISELSEQEIKALKGSALYLDANILKRDQKILNQAIDFYNDKNAKDPFFFASEDGKRLVAEITKRTEGCYTKEIAFKERMAEVSQAPEMQPTWSPSIKEPQVKSSNDIDFTVSKVDIEKKQEELKMLKSKQQEISLSEDAIDPQEKFLLHKYIQSYEALIRAEERALEKPETIQSIKTTLGAFQSAEKSYKDFIANAPQPKITKADLARLDEARNVAGAKYLEDSKNGMDNSEEMRLANELYVVAKKLFDTQNELIKSGGASKNPEMAKKLDNLETQYQEVRDKQMKPAPVSSKIDEQKQKEKIKQDENGDYVRVIEEKPRKKSSRKKLSRIIVPKAQVLAPQNFTIEEGSEEREDNSNWRSMILNDALSQ